MIFAAKNLICGYGRKVVLENVSLKVEEGDVLCILGPNGVGKTTLFKSILESIPLISGVITLDGLDVSGWSVRERAKYISYVPQSHRDTFSYSALEMVTMGRVAHLGLFSTPPAADLEIALGCMKRLEIEHLADKTFRELSGGEQQMVLIARALTQDPKLIVMDEPTSSLDYGNQVKVLQQIGRLAGEGISIIMTTHFPDYAFLCDSKVCLILGGDRILIGDASEIVTERNLKDAYGVDIRILSDAIDGVGVIRSCVPVFNRTEVVHGRLATAADSFSTAGDVKRA